jgi:hypothetical protein
MRQRIRIAMPSVSLLVVLSTGCAIHDAVELGPPERDGRVYYLDGAGGGGGLTNWGNGVRDGLRAAGFEGDFVNFRWQTGAGVAVDQSKPASMKRAKARKLAQMIREYKDANPDEAVNLVGLSAGTAIAVFALEELRENHVIDNAILLGSSLNADYDLTEALKRTHNRMYVFTSNRDTVLRFLMPLAGTADRKVLGGKAAGVTGFRLPKKADAETRHLYAKVVNIAWVPEFEQAGHAGGHLDVVNRRFVKEYVAPLVFQEGPRFMQAGARPAAQP